LACWLIPQPFFLFTLQLIAGEFRMHCNTKRVFSFIVGFLIFFTLITSPAAAVKVEGAKIMLDVQPGTNYIFPMAVSTKPTDATSDYAVEVYGFGLSVDGGSYTPLTASDDTGAYSARTFVTMEFPVIHIEPGQRKTFNATIRVPQDVGEGGRYAIIHIHPAAISGGGQTGFATAIIVPVMLTIQNTKLIETGTITEIGVGDIVAGKPITVSTTLKNTGNHHYYGVVNQVNVTDTGGVILATAKSNPAANAVIPGQSVRFDIPFSTPLAPGTYTLKSDMLLTVGVLDSRTTSITVKEAYIPPFQETSVKVIPESPVTLEVPGGTVRISFPPGAVLAETTVTVKPFIGTLPNLPAGAKAGTTAFSVDGLSGFLAKDATVTVRYTKTDLDAANSDASKLVLGRYDRGEAHWTLLPTIVDTNTMSLTTSTNRFSTWVVMVSGSGGSAGTPSKNVGLDTPLVFVALGMMAVFVGLYRVRKH
jgi:hypothetical protein